MDLKLVSNLDFDGIDHSDAPDYCDAFICSADYNGQEMSEEQLEELNGNSDFVSESLLNYLN